MQVRAIRSSEERAFFASEWTRTTQMTVSPAYLETSEIFGLYAANTLIGGFVLASGDGMAWPKLIDGNRWDQKSFPLHRCAELNLVWADPRFKKTTFDIIRMWWAICTVVAKHRADYITFACEDIPAKKNLVSRYEIISSGLLYRGPVNKYADRVFKIWWSTPLRFRLMKILYIPEYLRIAVRQHRKKRKAGLTGATVSTSGILSK